MFEKLKDDKVFRDVIHHYIHVEYKLIWELINSKEFQRLRRIHQLGGTYEVYHNADHSRFSHSLGVYEIVRRMVEENNDFKVCLSPYDKMVAMVAALLHDIGHMPFSHSFEEIANKDHESFSREIICDSRTEINKILSRYSDTIAEDVSNVLLHKYENKIVNQMISSQLDADRMDYLLRDAYFTGTSYGQFDLERILRTLKVKNQEMVIKESGVHSVENYILARYHMYWQVYYHPVGCAFEKVLESFFNRLICLYKKGDEYVNQFKRLIPFINQQANVIDHFELDENVLMFYIMESMSSNDEILSDLARRLINRDLFETKTIDTREEYLKIKDKVEKEGFDKDYYCVIGTNRQNTYNPYKKGVGYNINVLKDNKITELSKTSNIVESLVNGKVKEECRIYYPKVID